MRNNAFFQRVRRSGLLLGLSGFGLLFALANVTGCGGGSMRSASPGTNATTTTGIGRATFAVVWPERTRLIPVAANSIRVDILQNETVIATQLVTRPTNGGSATVAFDNLPVETLTARATALPQADGSGIAQAIGTVPLTIRAGEIVSFSLTMATTIDRITVAPSNPNLSLGQPTTFTATAWDADGNIVLTNAVKWESSNTAVASISATGVVTCGAIGSATITATETESGKAASVNANVTDPFAGVKEYLNLDLANLPNYANPTFPVHYDANIRNQNNAPPNNQTTDRGATLGRVLFYDKRLSRNDTVSCASCHQQSKGFSDSNQFSVGFEGTRFTSAHSMRIGNIRFYLGQRAFWDKRAATVEAQATQPIRNEVEMGFDDAHGGFGAVIEKMAALPYYPELFRWVFGDGTITEQRIQFAIAQFERSMVSVNSKFDTGFAQVFNPAQPQANVNAPFPNYTQQEQRGKQLFFGPPGPNGAGCNACHTAPTFALVGNSRSNGLDAGETIDFKSPSLKNIALGGPYMHDGRFGTLEQVVDHYISGIQNGPALDNRLKNPQGQPQRLPLTVADRDALVSFLRTLDDPVLTTDPKFSDPFKK